ncbi:uncharacterized protein L969DRAFT_92069 [Mixia osmundae IAM 14324]|uniref:Protein kinase domain-containing protein n=1 Tax=Mixia osmundae (strain CBS 9802 / IAM 14324 / JCM 22182 / KY 12970) TaxID=764103 RepID=G7DX93_MIXOS|nr:uncharacterized protein L969DRAFT_92069 [Mixia osmundae IAM 14324]KEI42635.1 hypothetical protein L969DRAFT_92069 [Mixia osmundae IAM 14324]GAA95203.1 hypothetical protein E5Q_01858 [Mixia osmundae IAM 14324]
MGNPALSKAKPLLWRAVSQPTSTTGLHRGQVNLSEPSVVRNRCRSAAEIAQTAFWTLPRDRQARTPQRIDLVSTSAFSTRSIERSPRERERQLDTANSTSERRHVARLCNDVADSDALPPSLDVGMSLVMPLSMTALPNALQRSSPSPTGKRANRGVGPKSPVALNTDSQPGSHQASPYEDSQLLSPVSLAHSIDSAESDMVSMYTESSSSGYDASGLDVVQPGAAGLERRSSRKQRPRMLNLQNSSRERTQSSPSLLVANRSHLRPSDSPVTPLASTQYARSGHQRQKSSGDHDATPVSLAGGMTRSLASASLVDFLNPASSGLERPLSPQSMPGERRRSILNETLPASGSAASVSTYRANKPENSGFVVISRPVKPTLETAPQRSPRLSQSGFATPASPRAFPQFSHYSYEDAMPSPGIVSASASVSRETSGGSGRFKHIKGKQTDRSDFDSQVEPVTETNKVKSGKDALGRRMVNQYVRLHMIGRGVHGRVWLCEDTLGLPDSGEGQGELCAIKSVYREDRRKRSLKQARMARAAARSTSTGLDVNAINAALESGSRATTSGNRSNPAIAEDDTVRQEIAIMKRLGHKHIVKLKEVIDDANSKQIFMVLEFCSGGQIDWQDPVTKAPKMTVDESRKIFRDVVLGLEYLHHNGIIHRDIKPANLLWATRERDLVKISDFGVSHLSEALTRTHRSGEGNDADETGDDKALRKTKGSPAFFAPELCFPVEVTPVATPFERGEGQTDYDMPETSDLMHDLAGARERLGQMGRPVSTRTITLVSHPVASQPHTARQRPPIGKGIDVWALGVTLYCLLFGTTPFTANTEYELYNAIPRDKVPIPAHMGSDRRLTGSGIVAESHLPAHVHDELQEGREAVDLLSRLLEKDPTKRISLDEVKTHPWVLRNLPDSGEWLADTDPTHQQAVKVTKEEVQQATADRAFHSRKFNPTSLNLKDSLKKAMDRLQAGFGLSNRNQIPTTRIRTQSQSSASAIDTFSEPSQSRAPSRQISKSGPHGLPALSNDDLVSLPDGMKSPESVGSSRRWSIKNRLVGHRNSQGELASRPVSAHMPPMARTYSNSSGAGSAISPNARRPVSVSGSSAPQTVVEHELLHPRQEHARTAPSPSRQPSWHPDLSPAHQDSDAESSKRVNGFARILGRLRSGSKTPQRGTNTPDLPLGASAATDGESDDEAIPLSASPLAHQRGSIISDGSSASNDPAELVHGRQGVRAPITNLAVEPVRGGSSESSLSDADESDGDLMNDADIGDESDDDEDDEALATDIKSGPVATLDAQKTEFLPAFDRFDQLGVPYGNDATQTWTTAARPDSNTVLATPRLSLSSTEDESPRMSPRMPVKTVGPTTDHPSVVPSLSPVDERNQRESIQHRHSEEDEEGDGDLEIEVKPHPIPTLPLCAYQSPICVVIFLLVINEAHIKGFFCARHQDCKVHNKSAGSR